MADYNLKDQFEALMKNPHDELPIGTDAVANYYQRFYSMIDRCPRVAGLWDRENNDLNVELFDKELGVMSRSEVAMAEFFASVWFHNNDRYGFDLADVASRLDPEERQIIIDWLAHPFYP